MNWGNYPSCCGIVILNNFYGYGFNKEQKIQAIKEKLKDNKHQGWPLNPVKYGLQLAAIAPNKQRGWHTALMECGFDLLYDKVWNPRHNSYISLYGKVVHPDKSAAARKKAKEPKSRRKLDPIEQEIEFYKGGK